MNFFSKYQDVNIIVSVIQYEKQKKDIIVIIGDNYLISVGISLYKS